MGDAIDCEGDAGPRRLGIGDRDRDPRGGDYRWRHRGRSLWVRNLRRGGGLSDGGERHGIGPDRVEAGVFARVPSDQPLVDHDAILEVVDPTDVAVHGGHVAPLSIAPELLLKLLKVVLGQRLVDNVILNPGDEAVPQASGFSGRARVDADLRGGGPGREQGDHNGRANDRASALKPGHAFLRRRVLSRSPTRVYHTNWSAFRTMPILAQPAFGPGF